MIYLTLAFITTPIFYLSGTIWPLQSMPARAPSRTAFPPRGTKAIAGVNQMGLSLNEVWGDVVMMLILGVVYTLLGFGVAFLRNSVALRGMFRKRRA